MIPEEQLLLRMFKVIADEAISLADAYAGGDSEPVDNLKKMYEDAVELERKTKGKR